MPKVLHVRISEGLDLALKTEAARLHLRPADVARMALAQAVVGRSQSDPARTTEAVKCSDSR